MFYKESIRKFKKTHKGYAFQIYPYLILKPRVFRGKIGGSKERSHSGLVRALGKRVSLNRLRGFDSLPLRFRSAGTDLRRDTVRQSVR